MCVCVSQLDVALEEVEALTQRCAELEMERTALAARHTPADTDNPDSLSGPMGSGGGTHEGAGGVSVSGGGGEGGGGGGVFWERQLRLRTEQLEAAEARLQVAAREAEQLQEQHAMQVSVHTHTYTHWSRMFSKQYGNGQDTVQHAVQIGVQTHSLATKQHVADAAAFGGVCLPAASIREQSAIRCPADH